MKWAGLALGTFGAVLGTALAALLDTGAVKRATNRVVAHARQIFDAAATDQHDRVFLQVVAFAADVGNDFEAVGEANLGDFAQRGIRLLRRRGVYARAYPALQRAALQCRNLGFFGPGMPAPAHELIDGCHG